jgi:hypothetical protein
MLAVGRAPKDDPGLVYITRTSPGEQTRQRIAQRGGAAEAGRTGLLTMCATPSCAENVRNTTHPRRGWIHSCFQYVMRSPLWHKKRTPPSWEITTATDSGSVPASRWAERWRAPTLPVPSSATFSPSRSSALPTLLTSETSPFVSSWTLRVERSQKFTAVECALFTLS